MILRGLPPGGITPVELDRLEGHRQKDDQADQTFTKRMGKRILPEFISIVSDPTLPSRAFTRSLACSRAAPGSDRFGLHE